MADKKGALANLPTYMFDDEDSVNARRKYEEALDRVTKSLDQRKNRIIDPKWAAAAEAFLTPKATGSSFESFGLLAKNLNKAQREEEEEEKMIAQQELEAARLGVDLMGRRKLSEMTGKMFDGQFTSPGAPQAGMGGSSSVQEKMIFESLRGKGASPQEIIDAIQKYRSGRIKVTEAGVYDLETQKFTPHGKGSELVSRSIYVRNPDGSVEVRDEKVPPSMAAKLDEAMEKGDMSAYQAIANMITQGPFKQQKPSSEPSLAPPSAPSLTPSSAPSPSAEVAPVASPAPFVAPLSPLPSAAEREATRAAQKVGMEATAKGEAERQVKEKNEILEIGKVASSQLGIYTALDALASSPDADRQFGTLERFGITPGLISLAESGVGVSGFSIGVPEIRGVYQRANLVPKLMKEEGLTKSQAEARAMKIIEETQLGASLMAQVQLQISRLQQGQGAVSDFERRLFGDAAITIRDNPKTIRRKLGLLRIRAEFDKQRAEALRKYKGNVDNFVETNEYKSMVRNYEENLARQIGLAPDAISNPEKYRDPFGTKLPAQKPSTGGQKTAPSRDQAKPGSKKPALKVDPSDLEIEQNVE